MDQRKDGILPPRMRKGRGMIPLALILFIPICIMYIQTNRYVHDSNAGKKELNPQFKVYQQFNLITSLPA